MKYIEDLISKSEKRISILVSKNSSNSKLTLIESHGGFINSKEKVAEENKKLIQFCEKNNINYISIDLSNNSTQKDQPINELRFSDRVKDIETVVDYVKEKFQSSIVLIGSSLGGLITLNASIYSDAIKGIILNCAVVKAHECVKVSIEPKEFNHWRVKDIANVWGVPMKYDFYEDLVNLDATKIIPKIKVPILWFHGTSDITVPIFQAREAKKSNKNIELVEIQDGGHRFGNKMKQGEWENKVEQFLIKLI